MFRFLVTRLLWSLLVVEQCARSAASRVRHDGASQGLAGAHLGNLLSDVLVAWLDPRVRLQ